MQLSIAKWGNSLSLRLPSEYVRKLGIKEGDQVEVTLTADGSLNVRAAKWNRKAFANELQTLRDSMPMGDSAIEEMRRGARY